jgi:hypothetical protein
MEAVDRDCRAEEVADAEYRVADLLSFLEPLEQLAMSVFYGVLETHQETLTAYAVESNTSVKDIKNALVRAKAKLNLRG